jgi:hypothetical protein
MMGVSPNGSVGGELHTPNELTRDSYQHFEDTTWA